MAEFEEVGVEAVVKGFPLFIAQLNAMSLAITGSGAASVSAAAGLIVFTAALAAIAAIVAIVVGGIALIVAGFAALTIGSIAVARSVETAFAGVAKTTNGLTDEFGKMNDAGKEVLDQFRELAKATPLPLEGLLRIGELAGQLGIAKESLAGFSEVVAGLAVATDLTIEEAALGLARLASIYGVTTEDMIENTSRLGSAITFLGNNFATNEPFIVNFSKRLAGIAKQFGISQQEVLGFGAAIGEAGVEAQLGSTAIQNALIAIGKAVVEGGDELDEFARVAGMSAEEFAQAWEDDAAQAFISFIEGLGEAGDEAFAILDEVGLSSDRTVRALIPLAAAGDLLSRAIDGANVAFEENVSLAREVAIRYATVDSQMQILKNVVRDIGLEIGLTLLPALSGLIKIVTPIIEAIGKGLVPAFESIFGAIKEFLLPALGDLFDAFGFDITGASLTQGIANFGETIADGIEAFSNFILRVAELIELYKEGGIDSVAEHFGITPEEVDQIENAAQAILLFAGGLVALKGVLAVGAAITAVGVAIAALNPVTVIAIGAIAVLATAIAFGADAWTTFTQAMQIMMILLFTLIRVIIETVVKPAKTAFEQLLVIIGIGILRIIEFFLDMWETIKTNTATAISDFVEAMVSWKDRTIAKIEELVAAAGSAVDDWWAETGAKIGEGIENAIQSIVDWKDRTIESIVTFVETAIAKVKEWWDNMIAAFNEKGGEVTTALGTILTDWVDKLNTTISDWVDAGAAMMKGLLKGLKDNVGKILTFIRNLANQILDEILAAFGISSPSMAFQSIGKNLMDGLARGIQKNADLPQIALDAAATRMMSAENGIASTSTAGGNTDRSFNPTINANYSQIQSPNSIVTDMSLVAMLEAAN